MSLWLQNILVVGLVLLAAAYLTWSYIQGKRKPKCRDCAISQALEKPSAPRPTVKQD